MICHELHEDWEQHPKHREQTVACLQRLELFTFAPFVAALFFASLESLQIGEVKQVPRAISQRLKAGWKISNDEASEIEYLLDGAGRLTKSNLQRWSEVQPILADKRVEG